MRPRAPRILAAVLAVVAVGCSGSGTSGTSAPALADPTAIDAPCGRNLVPPPTYEHVVWIFMENHTYDQVIGRPDAPFETGLAHRCGTATHYASLGSPSLPNYIGATSGDTHGITDDAGPASHPLDADNLFRQVRASGRQARSYQEAMPANCALMSAGTYAVKHNPAAYYAGDGERAACETDDVALGTPDGGALADALDHDSLPAYSFVTPDLCNDTHDCPVATGDAWLGRWLPRLVASTAYRSATTAIFVVWDEYTPIPSIVISPSTPSGSMSGEPFDHYSLLRTTEELLGIPVFLGRAASATSMGTAFGL